MAKMTKAQQRKFEEALKGIAKRRGTSTEEIKEDAGFDTLYSTEGAIYEAMAVFNFFKSRIEPLLEPKEDPKKFDARRREWRFRKCDGCSEEFAYAYHYEGVKFCSLDCLEEALRKIGITFSRHRDLAKRWGPTAYPAIVPSSALKALKASYSDLTPSSFETDPSPLPKIQTPAVPPQDIEPELDSLDSRLASLLSDE